jgi:hypothetical protein
VRRSKPPEHRNLNSIRSTQATSAVPGDRTRGWSCTADRCLCVIGSVADLSLLTTKARITANHCTTLLRAEEWADDVPRWEDDEQSILAGEGGPDSVPIVVWDNDDDGSIVQFVPATVTGLQDWYFRKGDPDPYPAVPHGHGKQDQYKKLDPYQGFITRKGHPQGRVRRRSIVLLWNEPLFRRFAFEAIQHFIAANPHWNWGGRNPLRLPKRRRLRS